MADDGAEKDSVYDSWKTSGDTDALMAVAREFAPLLTSLLGPEIGRAIGNAFGISMNSNFGGVPGHSTGMGFGTSQIFGTQDLGRNLVFGFGTEGVDATMSGVIKSNIEQRDAQLRQWHQSASGGKLSSDEIDKLMENPFSLVGIAHSFAWNSRGPDQLNQGLREAQQYMGVGFSPSSPEHQIQLREQAGAMATAVAKSFNDLSQAGNWSGAGGQDVGRIAATMGRTGGWTRLMQDANAKKAALGDNASDDDLAAIMTQLEKETVTATQQATAAVQSFKQIFKGSVTEAMRDVNHLLQTDVVQTFRDHGSGLAMGNRMAATGAAAGFTSQQMAGMVGISSQFSQAIGRDPWGAMSAASLTAQLMGSHRNTGDTFGFNTSQLQISVARRATGAIESDLAIDISGAARLVQQRFGDEEMRDFIAKTREDETLSTGTDVARLLKSFGEGGEFDDINAFDIRNAAGSANANAIRATGAGSIAGFGNVTRMIERHRRVDLDRELAAIEVTAKQAAAIRGSLVDKPLTMANLEIALAVGLPGADNSNDRVIIEGALERTWDRQARSFNSQNARVIDAITMAARDDIMPGRIDDRLDIQAIWKDKGNLSGLSNLNRYITKVKGEGATFTGAKEIYTALTGDTTATVKEIADFAGVSRELLDAVDLTKSLEDDHGLSLVVSSLQSMTIKGELMTQKEHDTYTSILNNKDLDAMSKIGKARHDFTPPDEEGGLDKIGLDKIEKAINAILTAIGGLR